MIDNKEKLNLILFGMIFTVLFLILFFYLDSILLKFFFLMLSIIFLILSLFKTFYLKFLFDAWMIFAKYLSMIFNPIIFGIFYIFLLSPLGILYNLFKKQKKIPKWEASKKFKEDFRELF